MIADVLPYFVTRMEALNLVQHQDTFNFANIPSSQRENLFHVEQLPVSSNKVSMDNEELLVPVTVRAFRDASCDTITQEADLNTLADEIYDEIMAAANRLNATGIKNVIFGSMDVEQASESNDNAMNLVMVFDALVIKSTR